MNAETEVVLAVPAGPRLDARLAVGPADRAGLVACHPHPLYGGEMDNPVVVRAVEVAREAGIATLRFNFRGVGRSEGVHGGGGPEEADAAAALSALRAALPPEAPVAILGYSFGAGIAAAVARADGRVRGLALVAPPLAMWAFGDLVPAGPPLLVVAGTRDPYCPVADLARIAWPAGTEQVLVEGADHFFFGKLFPLGKAIAAWTRRWSGG